MSGAADLLVLALQVLLGEIREWLNSEHNQSRRRKEGSGTSDSARDDRGSGQARCPAGSACSFAACGKSKDDENLERR